MSMIEWSLSDLHMQKYQILNITRFELKTINVRDVKNCEISYEETLN